MCCFPLKWFDMDRRRLFQYRFSLVVLVVLLLIAGKNLLEKKHLQELGVSMSTVYEDRLLAESYLYEIAGLLYRKRQLLYDCDVLPGEYTRAEIDRHNADIQRIMEEYEQTRLTDAEATYLAELREQLGAIGRLEAEWLSPLAGVEATERLKLAFEPHFARATGDLNHLSHIQVAEGRAQYDHTRQIVAGSTMLSHVEMVLLIGLGMILQALIPRTRAITARLVKHPQWN